MRTKPVTREASVPTAMTPLERTMLAPAGPGAPPSWPGPSPPGLSGPAAAPAGILQAGAGPGVGRQRDLAGLRAQPVAGPDGAPAVTRLVVIWLVVIWPAAAGEGREAAGRGAGLGGPAGLAGPCPARAGG